MIRNTLFVGATLALLIIFVDKSHSIDLRTLADQSSYRCSGGVVAVGELDRNVREKCGDPLEIGSRQDFGPIWIYYENQANFMYYLAFLNGKLQRIVGAPCSPDEADCLDLR
ncbi:MAG: DUF2845 domain-containing protein [Deltaproteobacteria bacterium]|nr:DUF2845 domain-containing protein [Deltaproteobacteria bacterium]